MMSGSDAPPLAAAATTTAPAAGSRGNGGGYSRAGTVYSESSGRRVVRPTAVTEKSLMESVAGFITEVQSYQTGGASISSPGTSHGASGSLSSSSQVTWARFEVADVNDLRLNRDGMDKNGEQETEQVCSVVIVKFLNLICVSLLRCAL